MNLYLQELTRCTSLSMVDFDQPVRLGLANVPNAALTLESPDGLIGIMRSSQWGDLLAVNWHRRASGHATIAASWLPLREFGEVAALAAGAPDGGEICAAFQDWTRMAPPSCRVQIEASLSFEFTVSESQPTVQEEAPAVDEFGASLIPLRAWSAAFFFASTLDEARRGQLEPRIASAKMRRARAQLWHYEAASGLVSAALSAAGPDHDLVAALLARSERAAISACGSRPAHLRANPGR